MRPAVRDLARYLAPARSLVGAAGALHALDAALTVAQAASIAWVIGGFAAADARMTPEVTLALAVVVSVLALRPLLQRLAAVLTDRGVDRCTGVLRDRVLGSLGQAGSRWNPDRVVVLVTEGVQQVAAFARAFVPSAAAAALTPLIVVPTVLVLDWRSGLTVAIGMMLLPVFGALLGLRVADYTRKQWVALEAFAARFNDLVTGLVTLVTFNRQHDAAASLAASERAHERATARALRLAFLTGGAFDLITTLTLGVVAVDLGLRLIEGSIGFVAACTVLLLVPEAFGPVRRIGSIVHEASDGAYALSQLRAITGSAARDAAVSDAVTAEAARMAAPLSLRNVTLGYGDEPDVIRGLTATLPSRGIVAITGDSGVGKSTLLSALQGEIAPRSGQVLAFGADLSVVDLDWWRANIAAASQAAWVLPATIRQNLQVAKADASDREMLDVLAELGLGGERFGLDERLADGGVDLSHGQRARLGIARVLLSGRRLLVLDEPTANLDDRSASLVLDALRKRTKTALIVVATHRAELVAASDQVIALRRVAANSSHSEDVAPAPTTEQATETRTTNAATPVVLGALALVAAAMLTACAGWLIVSAAERVPLMSLMTAIVAVRGLGLARPLLRYAERVVGHERALRVLSTGRRELFASLARLAPAGLGQRSETVLHSALGDSVIAAGREVRGTHPIAVAGIAGTLLGGAAALASGWAGALPVLLVTAAAVMTFAFARADARARSEDLLRARQLLHAHLETAVRNSTQFRAWGSDDPARRARTLGGRFDGLQARARGNVQNLSLVTAFAGAAAAGLTVMTASALELPATSAAFLLFLLLGFQAVLPPPELAGAQCAMADEARARLDALAATGPPVQERSNPRPLPTVGEVRHRELVLRWPGSHHRISAPAVTLTAGEALEVVGPSGSGKSTLAAAWARHIDPEDGEIRLDDTPLRDITLGDVRSRVVRSDATPYVFAASVLDNVRLGNPQATASEAEKALHIAGLGLWLDSLPRRLATPIGSTGRPLSGGERSRLGIARAVLAAGDVLILDEPGAHLDARTAETVHSNVIAANRDAARATLILAHQAQSDSTRHVELRPVTSADVVCPAATGRG